MKHVDAITLMCDKSVEDFIGHESYAFYRLIVTGGSKADRTLLRQAMLGRRRKERPTVANRSKLVKRMDLARG